MATVYSLIMSQFSTAGFFCSNSFNLSQSFLGLEKKVFFFVSIRFEKDFFLRDTAM